MSTNQFVIVAVNPYEIDEVDFCVGPFDTQSDADKCSEALIDAGGHPDAGWFVVPMKSYMDALAEVRSEASDLDPDENAPDSE